MAFNKIQLAVYVVSILACSITAYPEGVPPEACASMDPSEGHDGAPSTEPCIYATNPLSTNIEVGGQVVINLVSLNGTAFKGYMTMAFDASLTDSIEPLGTFGTPSDGQTVDCFDGTANAISHTDNNTFKKSVTATWTAPADFVGSVVFKTTFVRGGSTYWVKVPSTSTVTVGNFRGKLLHPSQLSKV